MSKYGNFLDQEESQTPPGDNSPLPLVTPATQDPEPTGKYADFVGVEELHATSVMFDAVQHSPDAFAQASKLAKRTGLPGQYIMRNMDSVKSQVKMLELQEAAALSPGLRKAFANTKLAPMIHDDVKELGLIEGVVNSFKRAPIAIQKMGHTNRALSASNTLAQLDNIDKQLSQSVSPDDIKGVEISGSLGGNDYLVARYAHMPLSQKVAVRQRLLDRQAKGLKGLVDSSQRLAQIPMSKEVRDFVGLKTGQEVLDKLIEQPGLLVSIPSQLAPESLVQAVPGLIAGAGALRGRGIKAGAATQGAYSANLDYLHGITEQLQKRGIDVNDTEAVKKALGDKQLIEEAKLGARSHAVAVGFFDGISFGLASKIVPGRPLATVMLQMPLQGGLGALGESGGQELEFLATAKKGEKFQYEMGKIVSEGLAEFVSGPVDVAVAAKASRQQFLLDKATRSAERTEKLLKLAEQSAQSKLKERDPQSFSEFVQEAAERTGDDIEAVYVDPDALRDAFNQDGIDPASIPGVADQMTQASELGIPVKIKIGDYMAHVAGTPLHDKLSSDIKADPDELTINEQKEITQQDQDAYQAELDSALADGDIDAANQADRETVKTNVLEQLKGTKRFKDDVADAYADLVANFYDATAKRIGVKASELFADKPLQIQSQTPGAAGFSQDAISTPEFQEFFGDSKVVDGDGKPLVVYHGSAASFDTFEKSKLSSSTRANSAQAGFFFTDSTRTAVDYAHNAALDAKVMALLVKADEAEKAGDWDAYNEYVTGSEELTKIQETQDGRRAGQVVYPTYLNMRNPVEIDAKGENFQGAEPEIKAAIRKAKRGKFDGVIIRNLDDAARISDESTHYLVFEPNQIKSAIGNSGQFDPNDPSILNQDGSAAARGAFVPGKDGAPDLIALLENADLSSFIHESGHFFLNMLEQLAPKHEALQSDMDTLLKWFGVESMEAWQAMSLDQKRPHHEKFARGFELYTFKGQAPSVAMQGIFQRFGAWMRHVYKQMKALNVTLTPEVTAVMDRMIASEEQIAIAKGYRDYSGLFGSIDESSLTDREWADYQTLALQTDANAIDELIARAVGDMKWLSNAKNKTLKGLQATAKALREVVQAEIQADVEQRQVYVTMRVLKTGKAFDSAGNEVDINAKINTEVIKEMYPDGEVTAADLRGMTSQEGTHPDVMAEMFGYTSGDHMIQDLANADPMAEVVKRETDQAMLEKHGDLATEKAIDHAANQALANEARGRLLRTELRSLERSSGGKERLGLINQAKQMAAQLIGRQTIRDLKPSEYTAAEARAGRLTKKRLASGDIAAARASKRNQMLHHYAAKRAHKKRDELAKHLKYLKKFNRPGGRKALDIGYLEQIDALLEQFDLKQRSQREQRRRASLAQWRDAQIAQGLPEPAIDPRLLAEARQQHYTTLTVDEFDGLVDTVKSIEHQARLKKNLLTAKDKREFAAMVAGMEKHAIDNAKRIKDVTIEDNPVMSGIKKFGLVHLKLSTFMRKLDGHIDGGPWWDAIMRPINAAGDRKATMSYEAGTKADEIFGKINLRGTQKVHIAAINDSLSIQARLSIALNWGNETSRRRVLEGDKWTEAQVNAILATLDPDHWQFVQEVWDFIDSYWPEIAAKQRRLQGVQPEKVAASGFTTPGGISMRGGYYPLKYDTRRDDRAAGNEEAEVAKQMMRGAFTASTTKRGHLEQRLEHVGKPVRKDLGVISQHLAEVIQDLTHHEVLIDVNRMLRDENITETIRKVLSPEALQQIRNHVEAIATDDAQVRLQHEHVLAHLRNGATVAALGASVVTAMSQVTGLLPAARQIGAVHMLRALGRITAHPLDMRKEILAKSEFMRNRSHTMSREVRDAVSRSTPKGKVVRISQAAWFYGIQKMQQQVDMPTWLAQYEKQMIATNGDEGKSIHLADQAVLDTQGGGQVKDQAAVQRGNAVAKMFTNFMSYGITQLNQIHNLQHSRNLKSPADMVRFLTDYLVVVALPAIAYELMKAVVKGKDLEDEEEWRKILLDSQFSTISGMFIGVREFGSAIAGFHQYSGPAGARFFSEGSKLYGQALQGEADAAFLKALTHTAGIALHLPSGQIIKTIEGAIALGDGKTQNPASLLFGPPK